MAKPQAKAKPKSGMPVWGWCLIGGNVVAVIAIGAFLIGRSFQSASPQVVGQTSTEASSSGTTAAPVNSGKPSTTTPAVTPSAAPRNNFDNVSTTHPTTPASASGNLLAGNSSHFGSGPGSGKVASSASVSREKSSRGTGTDNQFSKSTPVTSANKEALPAESITGIIENVSDGIVQIKTRNSEGKELGMGSGFLIDRMGVVVTNYHVIRRASAASASFRDGTPIEVTGCLSWSNDYDLAILKLERLPSQHKVLKLCVNLDRPSGSQVVAIGHPQGFKFTTTTGIVSALQVTKELPQPFRTEIEAPDHASWIQTSAAALPGSSGGPLLNLQSEVIGVNTWIIPKAGFTFSIDVRHLREMLDKIPSLSAATLTQLASLTGPEETLDNLKAEYVSRMTWFQQRYLQAPTAGQRKSLLKTHPAVALLPKFLEVTTKYPQAPFALDALTFVCSQADFEDAPAGCNKIFTQASDEILKSHVNSPRLTKLILLMRDGKLPATRKFLKRIIDDSRLDANRGAAELATAISLSDGTETEVNEALRLFDHVAKEYTKVEFAGMSMAELANVISYEMRHLAVGRTPPEITGTDQEGAGFKLSDYRGKVVVVDFFCDWCPHCVKMYPLERNMVTQYQGKPFALLGVNCDEGERLKDIITEKSVTWRCWKDGSGGPIAREWRVDSYPKLYVLDHTGKIRFKDVRGAELEAAVAKLVAEASGGAGSSRGGSTGAGSRKTKGRR